MKKIVTIFAIFFIPNITMADYIFFPKKNPFMNTYQNQFAFGIGQGFDTGWLLPLPVKIVPFYILNFQYSQPTSFFRIPARQSINLSQTIGMGKKNGWNWASFSIPIAYLSEDIALLSMDNFYTATGAGVGLQAHQNERISSKLLFVFKITFGYNFNERWSGELFIQHFSNANTSYQNNSYAFYGIGFTHNF